MTVGSDSFCLIFFDSLLPYLKSCYIQMPIFGKFNTASIGFFFFLGDGSVRSCSLSIKTPFGFKGFYQLTETPLL